MYGSGPCQIVHCVQVRDRQVIVIKETFGVSVQRNIWSIELMVLL